MNLSQNSSKPEFSVIVPIYNEEENIPELHQRLTKVMENLCRENGYPGNSYEILMIDDGSEDSSWNLIMEIYNDDPRIKAMRFSRNFGHHIALTAGIDHAEGNAVIFIDADLQDPPEEIRSVFSKFKEGFDIVYGIRRERQDPIPKKVTSSIFWWILRKFSGVEIPANQTMLRIVSRRMINVLKEIREYSRFVHGIMAWTGFRTATVKVKHSARARGTSKYNTARLFKLAFHAITSFSTIPLRIAIYIGLMSSFTSFIAGLYILYRKIIFDIPVSGYASIIVAIFFVGGLQLLLLGLFGEYLGRTYQEVQRRPLYIIEERFLRD